MRAVTGDDARDVSEQLRLRVMQEHAHVEQAVIERGLGCDGRAPGR